MPDTLAITNLFDTVVQSFEDDGAQITCQFGWRERGRKMNVTPPRIVWVPGDDKSGEIGTVAAPRSPGYVDAMGDRSLATLHENVTVYCCARNNATPEDERDQYVACRLLFDALVRALHHAVHGVYSIGKPAWVRGPNNSERPYGAAIRVVLTLQAVIPDTPFSGESNEISTDDDETKAELTTRLLDRQEVDTVTQE